MNQKKLKETALNMINIKALRKKAGMTQSDLSAYLCVSTNTVKCWEARRYSPSFHSAHLLFKLQRFLSGEEKPEEPKKEEFGFDSGAGAWILEGGEREYWREINRFETIMKKLTAKLAVPDIENETSKQRELLENYAAFIEQPEIDGVYSHDEYIDLFLNQES